MEAERKLLVATVTSEGHPQSGQDHRSSSNFSTQGVPDSYRRFEWRVGRAQSPGDVKFKVMEDVSGGTDPVVFNDLGDGVKTEIKRFRQIYIADPSGSHGGTFTVFVYAID